jgi:hypothetical protein
VRVLGVPGGGDTDSHHRYEALPSDYSLGANMMAGAFAGIAVSLPLIFSPRTDADIRPGTLGHVSC